MVIVTHGSDLSLAPAIGPLLAVGGSLPHVAQAVSKAGYHAIQLDATRPGLRSRDLDQRARQDLLAMLSRRGLRLAGLDLFIPRKHFTEREHIDRAVTALLATMELAADLGRVSVSIALPVKDLSDDVGRAIAEASDARDVTVAVHTEDQLDELKAWVDRIDQPLVGASLDPAAIIEQSGDPVNAAAELGDVLTCARLSDCTGPSGDTSSRRCLIGGGELDVAAYRMTLDLAKRRRGPVVLDLRRLETPRDVLQAATSQWDNAAMRL